MQSELSIFKKIIYSCVVIVLSGLLVEFAAIIIEKAIFRPGGQEDSHFSAYKDYDDFYVRKTINLNLPEIDFEIHRTIYEMLNSWIRESQLYHINYEVKDRDTAKDTRNVFFFGDSVTGSMKLNLLDPSVAKKLKIQKIYNIGQGGTNSIWGNFVIKNILNNGADELIKKGDIIFISYIWNDHWLRHRIDRTGDYISPLYNYLQKSHFVRLCSYVYSRFIYNTSNLECPTKVFRENYNAIIKLLKKKKVRTILWTAPTTLRNLELPLYYLADGNAKATSNVMAIHAKYNELVRTIAKDNNVEILDIDRYFRKIPPVQAKQLIGDTVHFTDKGNSWVMAEISRYLLTSVSPNSRVKVTTEVK